MRIFAFGSSLVSSYWNGAATYYRGIYKNLARLGHQITFAEPDIYGRQEHRDLERIEYARVRIYRTPGDLERMLDEACEAELIIKHSGVGQDDERLEAEVLNCRSRMRRVAFWDVDAPATLARLARDPADPFYRLIPQYDYILTYGGGPAVVAEYMRLGAKNCFPVYNALDPDTHIPVPAEKPFRCDLVFLGNRMPDREARANEFFFRAAEQAPQFRFLLGGEGWGGRRLPDNVRWIGHVGTAAHNAVNSSARMVLNINRESMASVGFSPPTRVFEAAGAAACLITDGWTGVEEFFAPGREILVAWSAEDVVRYLGEVAPEEARQIGSAMRARALREHTYQLRAQQVDRLLAEGFRKIPAERAGSDPVPRSVLVCEETE
jgi:spore maturation protein CgeB